jgi:hypothetical protein
MAGTPQAHLATRRPGGAIVCVCGDRLADRVTGDTVVIDGVEYQFRRADDHMTCRSCGASHPMKPFRRRGRPSDTGQRRRKTDGT